MNILEHKADINAKGYSNWTPLSVAAYSQGSEVLELLMTAKPSQETLNEALAVATEFKERGENAKCLLRHGAQPNIHTACVFGLNNLTAKLIKEDPPSVNETIVLLNEAAEHGHLEIVRRLLRQGVKIDQASYAGALGTAAKHGFLEIVQELVAHGANLEDRAEGETPLQSAASGGQMAVAEFLLSKHARLMPATARDSTALHSAAEAGQTRLLEYLVKKGIPINVQDYNGSTALHLAAEDCHPQSVTELLKLGADPNIKDHKGRTPLELVEERFFSPGETEKPVDRDAVVKLLRQHTRPD